MNDTLFKRLEEQMTPEEEAEFTRRLAEAYRRHDAHAEHIIGGHRTPWGREKSAGSFSAARQAQRLEIIVRVQLKLLERPQRCLFWHFSID